MSLNRSSKGLGMAGRFLLATVMLVAGLGTAQAATSLPLVQLPPHPSREEAVKAQTIFAAGGVIEMKDGEPKVLGKILNITFPEPHAGNGKRAGNGWERVCIAAAHRSADGRVHRFLGGRAFLGRDSKPACEEHFERWLCKQNGGSGLQDAGSAPDPSAWTSVAEYEIGDGDQYGNYFSETLQVYRANLNNVSDYYMVTKTPSSAPKYYNVCNAVAGCGWIHNHRWLNMSTDGNFPLASHGPVNQITSSSGSFSVGLSAGGPSFGYAANWSQDSVTTVDNTVLGSSATQAVWKEDFYNWAGGVSVPLTSKASFFSQQAAIFQVPAGTTSFNVVMTDQTEFRYYGEINGEWNMQNNYSMVHLNYDVPVSAPVFNTSTVTESVTPGSSGQLQVYATLPSSAAGLNWQIVDQPSWLSTTIVSNNYGGMIQFNVDPNQPTPQVGYLHINTTQASAAPSVRDGHPLAITFSLAKTFVSKPEVLITGGSGWNGVASFTAEVWDPATKTVTPTLSQMSNARVNHTATTLPDGRVLVTGGLDDSGIPSKTTDIFDPKTGLFSPGPNMSVERAFHTATGLSGGTVLIAGGVDSNHVALASAEVYDPTTNSFTSVGNMTIAAQQHTANLLWDGTVLIDGGTSGNANDWGFGQAMIYNPSTRSFGGASGLTEGRYGQFSGMLPGGLVFVAGGINPINDPVATAEIFTGMSMSFAYQYNMDVGRKYETGALLSNGKFLLAGGANDETSASLFDVSGATFAATGAMSEQRDHPAGVLLQGTNTSLEGQFLVVGGVVPNTGGSGGTNLETYNPTSGRWVSAGQMSAARASATATLCLPANSN